MKVQFLWCFDRTLRSRRAVKMDMAPWLAGTGLGWWPDVDEGLAVQRIRVAMDTSMK